MLAGLIDNTVILSWACVLAVVSFSLGADTIIADKRIGYIIALSTLTLPVVTLFAFNEAAPWRATPGKLLLGLRLDYPGTPSFARAFIRNLLKFLPWEVCHIGIWLIPGPIFVSEPTASSWAIIIAGEALALIWLASLFTPSGRTIHDRIAGLAVTKKPSVS
ncbi:RDD family protein [Parvularcula flava]|uniref:RDD family protein n=1 Tax=Aquisalinus luteolus TaxID=1566827 RepID=A0A8J3ERP9_9PROT|nr:RDD family protein [Aquisalinus luteolus]NHK29086.1 RDD family protein [Aquisalinus luteolus]GGI00355.1 hypothetical protein GCM10011355_28450 [Aquisalinus luteolus]